ncbi:unnamed protein product [Chrysoparadoxa australica]
MEKDQARIDALRARNEKRLHRFLNARVRTIGVDKDALDQQVAEREAERERQRELELVEVERLEQMRIMLEQREMDEVSMRKEDMANIQAEWRQMIIDQEARGRARREEASAGVCFEECGLSSLQKFAGEDEAQKDRVLAQHAQMSQWSKQQVAEKRMMTQAEEEEKRNYFDYMQQVAALRAEIEAEDEMRRKKVSLLDEEVKDENRWMADEKKRAWEEQQRREQDREMEEVQHELESLREDPLAAYNETGRVLRDAFKGFTPEQRMKILRENEILREEHVRQKEAEKQAEREMAIEYDRIRVLVEHAEEEGWEQRRQLEAERQEELRAQQHELAHRRLLENQDRFGGIYANHGIYAGFGKSCR